MYQIYHTPRKLQGLSNLLNCLIELLVNIVISFHRSNVLHGGSSGRAFPEIHMVSIAFSTVSKASQKLLNYVLKKISLYDFKPQHRTKIKPKV